MQNPVHYIQQRLSLRTPLQEALQLLADLSTQLSLQKDADLSEALQQVQALAPTCQDFERAFPSLAFAIATGVGKTRLMAACLLYLYQTRGIRNFFILAPNLTLYEKLKRDFGDPSYEKYVFRGIGAFVQHRPVIITGENYSQASELFAEQEVRINIFNIAKFNSETRAGRGKEKGKPPRVKRLSEYLGRSYWDYLMGLDDLVILMDEAHRYHASSSKKAIDELRPVLGLEMTATPFDEKGKQFQNVVYEYSLAQALSDGQYVKSPAIATRRNFKAKGLSDKELEAIKLEDAISLHEDIFTKLTTYAETYGKKKVKPFILVVCRDIAHAQEVERYIRDEKFFGGRYRDKVLRIDSESKSEDEIEQQFVSLESYDNPIEIVIHVNMLKEGWDVNNLYTIVPLRAANAPVLIEQTIGRGLRLPFGGERTGVEELDQLTVLAHDNFERVIEAAKDPNSILQKMKLLEIAPPSERPPTKPTRILPRPQAELGQQKLALAQIEDPEEKQAAAVRWEVRNALNQVLTRSGSLPGVNSSADLHKPEVKAQVMAAVKRDLDRGQKTIFDQDILQEVAETYEQVVTDYRRNIIDIPRMTLMQGEVQAIFHDFDLDTQQMNYQALQQTIVRYDLSSSRVDFVQVKRGAQTQTPEQLLVAELLNYPDIDYDDNAQLLFKLVRQALAALTQSLTDADDLPSVVQDFRRAIGQQIYEQMQAHFELIQPDYQQPSVLPFVAIESWHFPIPTEDGYRDYRASVQPLRDVPKYVYQGFRKSAHAAYKFESNTEKVFAQVLEQDEEVVKWLRPAPKQFRIYYQHNSKQYQPDFVVETPDAIYLVEPKQAKAVHTEEVQQKTEAALQYCHYATQHTQAHGGKPWRYLLIPHEAIALNTSFSFLVQQFTQG